ncbi:MAG: response regulator [Cyclobacteriaceae bacterium]|nr:response regulator [Cyclobacteriaceae bacterium]
MSKKILIVDDDNRNIFALSAVLKSRGFTCISTTNSKEGLDMALNNKEIGIVLLDMMMPEMDGYEVLSKIRESKVKKMPVIAVTAQAMVGDREKVLAAGADDYVSKPVDVDKMMKVLDKFLK